MVRSYLSLAALPHSEITLLLKVSSIHTFHLSRQNKISSRTILCPSKVESNRVNSYVSQCQELMVRIELLVSHCQWLMVVTQVRSVNISSNSMLTSQLSTTCQRSVNKDVFRVKSTEHELLGMISNSLR